MEMVKKVTVSLLDDLDGKAADETMQFALDGVSYEIDLSEKNAKKLRSELQPWVTAGRRTGGSRRRRGVRSASALIDRTESAAIREWARKSGHEIATRGRIPVEVIDAYRAAHRAVAFLIWPPIWFDELKRHGRRTSSVPQPRNGHMPLAQLPIPRSTTVFVTRVRSRPTAGNAVPVIHLMKTEHFMDSDDYARTVP